MALESIEQIDKLEEIVCSFEIKTVFDFSNYTFQEERLNFNGENAKKTL